MSCIVVSARIPRSTDTALKTHSRQISASLSDVLRVAIERYLAELPSPILSQTKL
jgi:predicted DNA-binding protein